MQFLNKKERSATLLFTDLFHNVSLAVITTGILFKCLE